MITEQGLSQFYGSENYYRHWTGSLIYTDGVHYLERNGAAWLLDLVASYQNQGELNRGALGDFQAWELTVNPDRTAVVTCRADSDVPPVITQNIETTDFPLGGIKLWVERGSIATGTNVAKILMLPSER